MTLHNLKEDYRKLNKLLIKTNKKFSKAVPLEKVRLSKKINSLKKKISIVRKKINELQPKNTSNSYQVFKDPLKLKPAGSDRILPDGSMYNINKYLSTLSSATSSGVV